MFSSAFVLATLTLLNQAMAAPTSNVEESESLQTWSDYDKGCNLAKPLLTSSRQLNAYPDGSSCTGEPMALLDAYYNQTFGCTTAYPQVHDIRAVNVAEAGKRALLYSDDACQTKNGDTGVFDSDGCHITPSNVSHRSLSAVPCAC